MSLAVKFRFLQKKKKSLISGHSANPALSIHFKTQGLSFQLEMRFGFAMSWY